MKNLYLVALMAVTPIMASAQEAPEQAEQAEQSPLAAAIEQHRAAAPDDFKAVRRARALRKRDGRYRLVGVKSDPALTLPHLARALDPRVSEKVRRAHARVAGVFVDDAAIVEMVLADAALAPAVRRAFIGGMRHNRAEVMQPLIAFAADAPARDLRRVAFVLSHRADRAAYQRLFEAGATHADAEVRRLSVQALGWTGGDQIALLRASLNDAEPKVRLAGLRALERLNALTAKQEAVKLRVDADPALQREAARILK